MRKPLEHIFMETALNFAERSTCLRKKVGAALVRDGRIVATSYSGSPPKTPHCIEAGCIIGPDGGCKRTIHAEANIIAYSAKYGISTNGTVLFTTLSPCFDCANNIIAAGIIGICYNEQYRITEPIDFLNSVGIVTKQLVIP